MASLGPGRGRRGRGGAWNHGRRHLVATRERRADRWCRRGSRQPAATRGNGQPACPLNPALHTCADVMLDRVIEGHRHIEAAKEGRGPHSGVSVVGGETCYSVKPGLGYSLSLSALPYHRLASISRCLRIDSLSLSTISNYHIKKARRARSVAVRASAHAFILRKSVGSAPAPRDGSCSIAEHARSWWLIVARALSSMANSVDR